jgi:hypothetical protein
MAMTAGLWTLNALSVELGISSRVLGKRLSGLRLDEVGAAGRPPGEALAPGARPQASGRRSDDRGVPEAKADAERARLLRAPFEQAASATATSSAAALCGSRREMSRHGTEADRNGMWTYSQTATPEIAPLDGGLLRELSPVRYPTARCGPRYQ